MKKNPTHVRRLLRPVLLQEGEIKTTSDWLDREHSGVHHHRLLASDQMCLLFEVGVGKIPVAPPQQPQQPTTTTTTCNT
jgi:hypothetical protein